MFKKIKTTDPIEQAIYIAFCEGRGYIFEMFFGWRCTKDNEMTFLIPTKNLDRLKALIKLTKIQIK